MPSVRTGAGRGAMGRNVFAVMEGACINVSQSMCRYQRVAINLTLQVFRFQCLSYRSLIAERVLYQFISNEVVNEVVRYTSMTTAMHSTARPVWFSAVFAIETTSG